MKYVAVHENKSIEDFSLMNESVISNTKLITLSIPFQVKLTTYDTIVIFGVSEMVISYFSRHLLSFPSHSLILLF